MVAVFATRLDDTHDWSRIFTFSWLEVVQEGASDGQGKVSVAEGYKQLSVNTVCILGQIKPFLKVISTRRCRMCCHCTGAVRFRPLLGTPHQVCFCQLDPCLTHCLQHFTIQNHHRKLLFTIPLTKSLHRPFCSRGKLLVVFWTSAGGSHCLAAA